MAKRRLIIAQFGSIASDGTGTVTTSAGKVSVEFKVTKAFPKGALYDKAGRAYDWPARPPKEGPPSVADFIGEADAFSDAQTVTAEV